MSVADDFQAFRANYLIPPVTVSTISTRYKRITKQLNRDFWSTDSETAHSLYVGSYGRDTAAKGVSDLDVAFKLPLSIFTKYSDYNSNGQSALLQAIRASIQKTYSVTKIGGDGQVVAVAFDDGITFEILPVFETSADCFLFPDSNGGGQWKVCYPRKEMEAFAIRDKYTANGNLKALCRMMRIWKRHHYVTMSGMLIDTLAYQFIANWQYREKSFMYHDWIVRDFLKYISELNKSQDYWRAPGSESFVWKTGNFQWQAKTSYQDAVAAIDHATNDRPYSAKAKWRDIFGPTFP